MTESTAKDTAPSVQVPTTVVTRSAVSLADHLNLRELPLATTPGGKVFSLKALHPADHEIKTSRVPGGNKMSVAVNCDMVETIPITAAQSEVGITVAPHPLVPCSVEIKDGSTTTYHNFLNAAFGGQVTMNMVPNDLWQTFRNTFTATVENYRITSQSVTIELIAPSLSDQGTITACQYALPPKSSGFVDMDSAGNQVVAHPEVLIYELPVVPSKMVLGTSAYTAKAREGCYLPLKLTDFSWQSTNDAVNFFNAPSILELGAMQTVNLPFAHSLAVPFHEGRSSVTGFNALTSTVKCCGDNFGFISMNGMAANVAVRIRVRQTLEISGYPSSMYAPLMEIALPPDETAIRMYFEVSNRCKDGYPASYNDLAKLKNVVTSIAKNVLPFVEPALAMLSKAPGVPGAIGKAGKMLLPVAQSFSRAAEQTPDSAWSGRKTGGGSPNTKRKQGGGKGSSAKTEGGQGTDQGQAAQKVKAPAKRGPAKQVKKKNQPSGGKVAASKPQKQKSD